MVYCVQYILCAILCTILCAIVKIDNIQCGCLRYNTRVVTVYCAQIVRYCAQYILYGRLPKNTLKYTTQYTKKMKQYEFDNKVSLLITM